MITFNHLVLFSVWGAFGAFVVWLTNPESEGIPMPTVILCAYAWPVTFAWALLWRASKWINRL